MSRVDLSAVSPEFCIEGRDVSDFVTEFGPFAGRYVSRLPRDWIKEFHAHVSNLSDQDRLEAVALLEKVRHSLVDLPRRAVYDVKRSWSDNILDINREHPFMHIVGSALSPEPFPAWTRALRAIREQSAGGRMTSGTAEEYLGEIEALLLMSPACYLIDPYFRVVDRLSDGTLRPHEVLIQICRMITGSKCYQVHVIARKESALKQTTKTCDEREWSVSEFEGLVEDLYQGLLAQDRELFVHLVRDDPNDGSHLRLHTRYFLTRHGALDFGYGFQPYDPGRRPQVPVKVVPRAEHEHLVDSYIHGVAGFLDRRKRNSDGLYPWDVASVATRGAGQQTQV